MNCCTKGAVRMVFDRLEKNLIVNYINAIPREGLGGKTPYAAALETYGEDILKALQLRLVAPDEVNLTPKLIMYNR